MPLNFVDDFLNSIQYNHLCKDASFLAVSFFLRRGRTHFSQLFLDQIKTLEAYFSKWTTSGEPPVDFISPQDSKYSHSKIIILHVAHWLPPCRLQYNLFIVYSTIVCKRGLAFFKKFFNLISKNFSWTASETSLNCLFLQHMNCSLSAHWLLTYSWLIALRFEPEWWRLRALDKFEPKEQMHIVTSWAPVEALLKPWKIRILRPRVPAYD